MSEARTVRCAIYTRTSSDEKLLQDYNSLAAQRDACAAYILSQKHEGWTRAKKVYEDGGFSGGSLERPALSELLKDLAAGEFDVIVIYKIDRLTRSLRDFSRLSETLDRHGASFVAVTQQFNTATSMGRLTLNILLTFAQFEREVAGDRIRDKIASSKRLGIWMGGNPPLGYDAPNKKLVVNPREAEIVRHIHKRFLALESMSALVKDLNKDGIISKVTIKEDGSIYGGNRFSSHPLTTILTNPVYKGMIRHKGTVYPGRHEAIVSNVEFERVQKHFRLVAAREKAKRDERCPSLLKGLIFTPDGEPLYPVHVNRKTKRYTYYTSSTLLHRNKRRSSSNHLRFSSEAFERRLIDVLCGSLRDRDWVAKEFSTGKQNGPLRSARELANEIEAQLPAAAGPLQKLVTRIEVDGITLCLFLNRAWLAQRLDVALPKRPAGSGSGEMKITLEGHGVRCRNEVRAVLQSPGAPPEPDHRLVRGILRAVRWYATLASGEYSSVNELAEAEGCCPTLITDRVRLAFLAPDIMEAILEGRQPRSMTLASLRRACPLPLCWEEQRALLL